MHPDQGDGSGELSCSYCDGKGYHTAEEIAEDDADAPEPEPCSTQDRAAYYLSLDDVPLENMAGAIHYAFRILAGEVDTDVRAWLKAQADGGDTDEG